jgi:molecular chaperone HscA
MPAGMARLEVTFFVDENNLLTVTAKELTTGNTQKIEVKPSYGLSDDEIEEMLIDALDHGEEDYERRALADARVEAQRILSSTKKSLAEDSDLLEPAELSAIEEAAGDLEAAIVSAKLAAALQGRIDALDDVTHAWAGRRMNRAIQQAISGKDLSAVEESVAHAAGVEAHLEAHGRGAQGSK